MKHSPDSKRTAGSLPAFLDAAADAAALATAAGDAQHGDAVVDGDPAGDVAPGEPAAADAHDAELPADGLAGPATAADDAPPPSRPRRGVQTRTAGRGGSCPGMLGMALGIVALVGGCGMAIVPGMAVDGVAPNVVFVLGALLFGAGVAARHIGRLQQRLDDAERERRVDSEVVQQHLRTLVDGSNREPVQAPGDELQHLLMSLQRQDEKINNLTRAIKMYGKPLMEITGQGTEVAGTLAGVKTLVEGGTESTRQAINRLETQVRAASGAKELADLTASLHKLGARVDALAAKGTGSGSLEPVTQQLTRLEVTVAAIGQRLEDTEVRKSLLRLEETTQKGRDALHELVRGDAVRSAASEVQQRVDTVGKGLADGLARLRDGNLAGLEHSVRDIQREVAGVATAVAQIHAGIRNAPRAAVAAAATPAPAAAATAAPATPPAPAPADGAPGYQTGTRTSGGKNVLGAIAKLKQMKG